MLDFSHLLYVEFTPRQTALTVMLRLERGFHAFRGVPQELLFDQMKAFIVKDHRGSGSKLLEVAEFLRFAAH